MVVLFVLGNLFSFTWFWLNLIEFDWILTQADVKKIQPVVTKLENTIRKENTNDVLSIQRENGNGIKIPGKSDISEEEKQKRKKDAGTSIV